MRADDGFFGLIYVCTNDVEINIQRIKTRFASGGHDVPVVKTRSRFKRSIQNVKWFLDHASIGLVFDTSSSSLVEPTKLVAKVVDGKLVSRDRSMPIAESLSDTLDAISVS